MHLESRHLAPGTINLRRALLSFLLSCGLPRHEAAEVSIDHLQRREGHWAIVDLSGKGGHVRTVPVPDRVYCELGDELDRNGLRRLMPQLERWGNLAEAVRQHLIERMRDRAISLSDLNQLRLWVETRPEVPEDDWYKDFGYNLAPDDLRGRTNR